MNLLSRLLLGAFAAVKFSKLLLSGGSMLLAVVVYAFVYGWRYAVGFVALLFIHELGHLVAARQRGLDVGWPTFIPFLGAWIELKQRPHDAETEAYVGLGGPVLGSIGALVCYFLARNYDVPWLLALAYAGFMLNLFNLVPMAPFDGGRIMAVLSPRLWLLGVPIFLALFWWNRSPVMIVMAILAVPYVLQALRHRPDTDEARAYYTASAATRWTYGAYYLLLVLFLSMMVVQVHASLEGRLSGRDAPSAEAGDV